MPIYCFECPRCGHKAEEFAHKPQRPRVSCAQCRTPMAIDFQTEVAGGFTDWAKPLESEAAGIDPKAVPQALKLFPHHDYNPATGAMRFHSRAHRKRCLADIGMVDRSDYCGGRSR